MPINSNESNEANQTANPWHAATSSSNFKSSSCQQQPLPLKNKYSVLRVEDEENPEINEDIAAKQVIENGQSTSDESSLKESAFNKKRWRHKGTKTNTVIVGDSMIKLGKGWEISSAINRVTVKSFSGATIEDISDFMEPILRKKPEKVILHCLRMGTNNLRKGDAKSVADGIINLAQSIEQQCPDIEIIVSGIITKSDVISALSRVRETNELVKSVCNQKKWIFIPNTNLKTAHLR